jgi:quercetin dioxygenase-like cupin family protein
MPLTHFVGRADWSFADNPQPSSANSHGLSRSVMIGPAQGAVHTELALTSLAPGGWLNRHFHSYEEALYVLSGELISDIDGHVRRLGTGDFTLHPIGMWHSIANDGTEPTRLISINTPQKHAPDAGRKDTFFTSDRFDLAEISARAEKPIFDPTVRNVGHYGGTPPLAEAVAVADAARGRRPAGADTALLVYSGIGV